MNFQDARKEFQDLKNGVKEECVLDFLKWIQRTYLIATCRGEGPAIAHMKLRDIAEFITSLVPQQSVMPSEHILPCNGKLGKDPEHVIHVDAFLYDECQKMDLILEGKLPSSYCLNCNSQHTAPLNLFSHSSSRQRLEFLFNGFLPSIDSNKLILDVGSRLGAVLYAAYCHTNAGKIIGVERNVELCSLQKKVVDKFNLSDRIQVICNDIKNELDIVCSADVIFLFRPFESFLSTPEQILCWKFLASNIKPGAIIVCCPSLKESLENLKTEINLEAWVRKREDCDPLFIVTAASRNESPDVLVYDVISPCKF